MSFVFLSALLFGSLAHSYEYDLCKTQYTEMHYAKTRCLEIARPLPAEDGGGSFILKGVFAESETAGSPSATATTLIFIPSS